MNPYTGLPDKSYWRTGVASLNPLDHKDLYKKKFNILPDDKVATAGSCFAQHIGRHMQERGFGFTDYEPPSLYMDPESAKKFGYHMYSARFGNIYTVRQLHQLFQRAFGAFVPQENCWITDGRFYDPFRPSIEPNGYQSMEEMLAVQQGHLESVRTMFTTSDIFVFTLGLTEAWSSKLDGAIYPICPGTVAGTFSDSLYQFHNFNYLEIISDLEAFITDLRSINPSIKFILTVSPVPLTATASGNHIQCANTYSKSVLRAVAGDLERKYDFIDYFPSYEIIAATSNRAMFYNGNLRTVSNSGVSHVMSYFFSEHQDGEQVKVKRRELKSPSEVLCDEAKLDSSIFSG